MAAKQYPSQRGNHDGFMYHLKENLEDLYITIVYDLFLV